jgi:hypothetical protein
MRSLKLRSIVAFSLLTLNLSCEKSGDDTGDSGYTEQPSAFLSEVETELINFGGCGDVFMYAYSDSDEIGLFISASGIVQQAFDSGNIPYNAIIEIGPGDDQARVVLQSGQRITTEACNDLVIYNQRPSVDEEAVATGGTLNFKITPSGDSTDWGELPAGAEIVLSDVEFTTDQGDTIIIDDWGFDAFVGWLPG